MLTPKKDGTYRVSIDYRRLNELDTVFDSCYPVPLVDDALQALGGALLFRNIDLLFGYWQIEMDEKSKAMILNGLTWVNCLVYLDNVLCFADSNDLEEPLRMADQVFEPNVMVNLRKSAIGKRRVVYLGHCWNIGTFLMITTENMNIHLIYLILLGRYHIVYKHVTLFRIPHVVLSDCGSHAPSPRRLVD